MLAGSTMLNAGWFNIEPWSICGRAEFSPQSNVKPAPHHFTLLRNMKKRTVLAALVISAAVAAALSATSVTSAPRDATDKPVSPRAVTPRGPLLEGERSLIALFEAAAPSVAYITTENLVQRGFFGTGLERGAGSGFVWDTQGHVVTNFHVIQDARKVTVQLDTGKEPVPATFVGGSADYDLAVVKLSQIPVGLKPIPLGTSRDLKIGQSVIAIGKPFGLSRTLTQGVIRPAARHGRSDDLYAFVLLAHPRSACLLRIGFQRSIDFNPVTFA